MYSQWWVQKLKDDGEVSNFMRPGKGRKVSLHSLKVKERQIESDP